MIIAGFQKLTLLDFPGRTACILFTRGCNFRCPFCHNRDLVVHDTRRNSQEKPADQTQNIEGSVDEGVPQVSEEEIFSYLKKRQGLLDGVVITGGEPLLWDDLPQLIENIRELGYEVKLDTNGSFPESLGELLNRGLVDYVAMDIKNSPRNYHLATGVSDGDFPFAGKEKSSTASEDKKRGKGTGAPSVFQNIRARSIVEKVDQSLYLLQDSGIPFELRTTLVKGIHVPEDMKEIGSWIAKSKAPYYLQNYQDSGRVLNPKGLSSFSEEELDEFRSIACGYGIQTEKR